MSGRCHNSEKDGCSSPPLTSGACCLESIAALVESPGGIAVPVVSSRGVSSSTKQVGKRSSELLALKFCRVSLGGSLFSFSNSIEGWLCMASSKLISSTYAMGGVRGLLLRRVDAMASALSNFLCRWRRDSALYQAAPLRDFPLILGMVETLEGTRVPVGLASLPQSFSGALSFCSEGVCCGCAGGVNTARSQCFSAQFLPMIMRNTIMTANAIKAWCWVLCRLVQFPRARGLIIWRWLVRAMAN
jgi:hypothetical protein